LKTRTKGENEEEKIKENKKNETLSVSGEDWDSVLSDFRVAISVERTESIS